MSKQFVTRFRFYWDDADHALERWLEEMAHQGLHLQSVGWLRCVFTFRRGAPAEMAYRIDFQVKRVAPDYVQLFVDAGWEHVDQSLGWQVWRAPLQAGRAPEIFTDVESSLRKYQRLLWLFVAVSVLFIVLLPFKSRPFWESPREIALTLALAGFNVYAMARLALRIRRLRKREP